EWRENLRLTVPRERVVLSHHDYEGVSGDLDAMLAFGCAHTKMAVTPETLDENLRLLAPLTRPSATLSPLRGARDLDERDLDDGARDVTSGESLPLTRPSATLSPLRGARDLD